MRFVGVKYNSGVKTFRITLLVSSAPKFFFIHVAWLFHMCRYYTYRDMLSQYLLRKVHISHGFIKIDFKRSSCFYLWEKYRIIWSFRSNYISTVPLNTYQMCSRELRYIDWYVVVFNQLNADQCWDRLRFLKNWTEPKLKS